MSAFSSIKLVPILFIAVAISSQLPHEEDYFSSVIPVKLTRRINSTKFGESIARLICCLKTFCMECVFVSANIAHFTAANNACLLKLYHYISCSQLISFFTNFWRKIHLKTPAA